MESPLRARRWALLGAGLLLYLMCLLITAPASLMAWAVARASNGMILLEQPEGRLWRGRGSSLVLASASAGPQTFGSVTWNAGTLRLLTGKLAIDVTIEGSAQGTGTLIVRRRSIQLVHTRLAFAAIAAIPFFPALQLVQPRGEIAVHTEDLLFSDDTATGNAEALWKDASSALSPVKPLGTYRARIERKEGPARFEITTAEGALQISGSGTWVPAKGASFDGVARAQSSQAQLEALLRLLGRDTGNGSYQLQYAGPP